MDSSIDACNLNTKHIITRNICKCKTMHANVGDKKGFIKDSNAFRGRPMCNLVSRSWEVCSTPPRHNPRPHQELLRRAYCNLKLKLISDTEMRCTKYKQISQASGYFEKSIKQTYFLLLNE